LLYILTLKEDI